MNDTVTTAASTVNVGCKLPNGLHLDLKNKSGEVQRITLEGSNASRIIGGFGITENVPSEFMTEWLRKNAKHPAVVNNEIFVHNEMSSVKSIARERTEIKTGLEAIDPVANGMLVNEHGEIDKAALKNYNKQREENPNRNAQRVE